MVNILARIVDSERNFNGSADPMITADRGFIQILGPDFGFWLFASADRGSQRRPGKLTFLFLMYRCHAVEKMTRNSNALMRDGSVMADSDLVDFLSGSTDSAIKYSRSAGLHITIHSPPTNSSEGCGSPFLFLVFICSNRNLDSRYCQCDHSDQTRAGSACSQFFMWGRVLFSGEDFDSDR